MDVWTQKETARRNPNFWMEELRPQIMQRIADYEAYLKKWGIIAQTGIEQEFLVVPQKNEHGRIIRHNLGKTPALFPDSPFIEKMYPDHWPEGAQYDDGYEIVMGIGNGAKKKTYPDPSLEPHVMVRAAESLNRLIAEEAGEHGLEGISFDPTEQGRRLYAQQVNISLWDRETGKPLFSRNGVTELGEHCISQLLEAQNALVALFTVNPNAFGRFVEKRKYYVDNEKDISLGEWKTDNPSVLFRGIKEKKDTYIENRLGHSDMPPSVNMLVTLAGIARGVEEYIRVHRVTSPNQLHELIARDTTSFDPFGDGVEPEKFPQYKLPRSQEEAFKTTQNSDIAKDILGDALHREFLERYRKNCSQGL